MAVAPFTGRKVFFFVAAAFAVIFTVNIYMATQAVRTFPGLEVKNGYIASQKFDAQREAQTALGWDVSARYGDGQMTLKILGSDGSPAKVKTLIGTLGRATHTKDDMTPVFVFEEGVYVYPVDLAPGNWNFRMFAVAEDGTEFQQRVVLHVKAGA
ncbi:MAG: FixH family protein [Pseudoruegeria sp.]